MFGKRGLTESVSSELRLFDWSGRELKVLNLNFCISAVHQPFYISIFISILPAQPHTTVIETDCMWPCQLGYHCLE